MYKPETQTVIPVCIILKKKRKKKQRMSLDGETAAEMLARDVWIIRGFV